MTANINVETGIAYGVVSGNSVPYLLDDIFSSGDSLTYAAYKEELAEDVSRALENVLENRARGAKDIVEGIDIDEIVESLLDSGLNDQIEFDEEEHEYSETVIVDGAEREVHYLQSFLGGAPLIWVTESPYLARAAGCSPCVPGAGDLDSIYGPGDEGTFCYCIPPDAFNSEDESADRYEIVETVEVGGKTYKVVAKIEAQEAGNDSAE